MRRITNLITTALAPASILWALPGDAIPTPSAALATVVRGVAVWRVEHSVPPVPWRADDPADSLYRAARRALSDGRYDRAATLFHQIPERFPSSEYAPDAPYWEAFARYRIGGERELRTALGLLELQGKRFPKAATRGDAKTLATRIQGALAKGGDPGGVVAITQTAQGPDRTSSRCGKGGGDEDDESDARISALNALMQMDAERAMPILRDVLARRDACSEPLRRKAVFLVAQKNTPDAVDLLLDVARRDPDAEVRQKAVFWMSQVGGQRVLTALDSILRRSTDTDLREKAIFALSQQHDGGGSRILRDYAQSSAPEELRAKAVFWLGQHDRSAENAAFLRALYAKDKSEDLRSSIVQAMANVGGEADTWLFAIAQDPNEGWESRKKALFWLGQQRRVPVSQFVSLYDRTREQQVKEHLVFVLSQRQEKTATDKLIDIARHETDREVRGKALFWLGQKDDPRVKQLLLEIINQ